MVKKFKITLFLILYALTTSAQINPENSALIDSLDLYPDKTEKRLDLLKNISFNLRLYDPDSAIYYALKGLDEAKQLNKPDYIGGFYQRAGIAYRMKGDFLTAIEMYKKAEDTYLSIGAEDGLAGVYNSLGILFSITKNFPVAISYFEKLIEIDKRQKYYPGLVLTYSNLAGIYTEKKDVKKAEEYYKKALDIHNEFKITTNRVTLWNNIGSIQLLQGNLDSALNCFRKSLEYNEDNNAKSRMHSLLGIGQTLKTTDPVSAEDALIKANEIATSSDDRRVKADINLALSITYKSQRDFEKAYKHLNVYSSLRDSLFSGELIEQINELEIKYETEKKELEIASEKRKNIYSYIITGFLVIILFLVANRLLAQKKINRISREKLESEVDYKNRLLASRTIDLSNFGKLLSDFNEKVNESNNQTMDELVSTIKKSVKQKLKDVDDWQQVKLHFEEVHPRFFDKLSKIEPPLTANEQKHAAYIKMKISNKDIARMLNVNLTSIHVVHHRLKKKLGLSENESLGDFVETI